MLATLGSPADLHNEEDWAFEMKWDGLRAIVCVGAEGTDRGVRLFTRNGNDVTESYPDLIDDLTDAVDARSAVLDGEIVAVDSHGRPSFSRLQTRMGLTAPRDVQLAAATTPVRYVVFDVLERDGVRLVGQTYDQRRGILMTLVSPTGSVQVPSAIAGDFAYAFERSSELGLEGVIAKEHHGYYHVGQRSRSWIKIKHHRTQEVVIGGWRPGNGRRADTIGSLLLGLPAGDSLTYIGRVGTGFRDRDLSEIRKRLEPLSQARSPFNDVPAPEAKDAVWVSPALVGEVEFAEWTASGRLRQPSWRGWRPDKSPGDVVREETL